MTIWPSLEARTNQLNCETSIDLNGEFQTHVYKTQSLRLIEQEQEKKKRKMIMHE